MAAPAAHPFSLAARGLTALGVAAAVAGSLAAGTRRGTAGEAASEAATSKAVTRAAGTPKVETVTYVTKQIVAAALSLNDADWLSALPAIWVSRLGSRFEEVADDTAMAAMGAYMRTIRDWRPRPWNAPTLFLRASDPLPQTLPAARSDACWHESRPYDVADVPGNHLELIDGHVRTTAEAIRGWLASRSW